MRCFVPFCKNTEETVTKLGQITFHDFPTELHLRTAWLEAIGKQDCHLVDFALVCSQHFLSDDIYERNGLRQICAGAIPSTIQVCMICLEADSKQIVISKYKLETAYENLTGNSLCDVRNLKQTLCVECAQRLINFSKFKDKSLRTHSLMTDLVTKHDFISIRHIKSINRVKNQLKSNFVKTTLEPNRCDLHIRVFESEVEEIKTELDENATETNNDSSTSIDDDDNIVDNVEDEVVERRKECISDYSMKTEISVLDNAGSKTPSPSILEESVTETQELLQLDNIVFECGVCSETFLDENACDEHVLTHQHQDECDLDVSDIQLDDPLSLTMVTPEPLTRIPSYDSSHIATVSCGMVWDLPVGRPLETAISPRKAKGRPAPVPKTPPSQMLWSSLETVTPSSPSSSSEQGTPRKRKPAAFVSPHKLPAPGPSFSNMVLSPARSVKVGASSGTSTRSKRRSSGVGDSRAKRRRCLIPSSSVGAKQCDFETSTTVNYGSEEESDEEKDQPLLVPRVARMLMDEADEDGESCANISLEWPPQPPRPSICDPIASSSTVQPTQPIMESSNKFHFEWRAFSTPQIDPRLRREPFSQNSGPTVSFTTPYEAFTAIWDREIMGLIVRETNIYAQQLAATMLETGAIGPTSRITRWHDTNVNELYTYLAIVLAMGSVVKSSIGEYWNNSKDIFRTPGFSTEMSLNRFQLLSKCLHFNNNRNCDSALLIGPQAKLYKIQPILDHLNGKFSQLYNLSQNVALDESLTMWKGWLNINQVVRNKAATVGIKSYEVCESQTGYLWRFEVHAGHHTAALQDDPVSGTVPALVLRLLNGLEHRGHTIWMDNYYNSPALARELKILGFDCVGTLRKNRQFVPSELARITKNDMAVGQVFGCTSGDVDLMVWRDNNLVGLISTYHGLATTKCGDTLKPTVVHDYNICMGGVDRKDQRLAMYPIERKRTKVWYKKFFRRLLNASVLNSCILLNNKSLTHRQFRRVLINDLLAAHRTPAPTPHTPLTPTTIRTAIHSPAQYDVMPSAARSKSLDRYKRQCAVCKKRVTTYCKACNVPMCMFTCYEPYHTSH